MKPFTLGHSNLTGVTRYRSGWFGGLVLQVEEKFVAYHEGRLNPTEKQTPVYSTKWRDAKVTDIDTLEWHGMRERGELRPPPDPIR